MPDHRPRYHVSAESGWLNDPAGPIERDGWYHLFFQHNPAAAVWDRMHWGHVRSRDLVRWERLPIALAPSPGGPDEDGCWTGCAVDDGGVPTILYSGHVRAAQLESVCLARGTDDLVHWRKDARSPVLSGLPEGLVALRDPLAWREADGWSLLLGAGLEGEGGAVLRFRSSDLLDWTYDGVVLSRDVGRVWECPQLFPLGDRHVLIVSVWDGSPRYPLAFVGHYRDGRFEPELAARFDHGTECYAPATLLDGRGRRVAWAWSWEARDEPAAREQGWAGVLTLPRVLSLRPDGQLGIAPAPELESLRAAHERLTGGPSLRPSLHGRQLELRATVSPGRAGAIGLDVAASPGGEERTTIAWSRASGRLELDRSRSSLDPRAAREVAGGPLELGQGEDLELRVFLDSSIVEVFANGTFALTGRIYPSRPDSSGVALSDRR